MKIATLTFHRTTNYGALFQTFALQKVLENLGYETEVLDYRCDTIEKRYQKPSFFFFLKPKNIARIILKNSYIRDNRNSFRSFLKRIKISAKTYTSCNVFSANSIYDKFIVGSDQVWNWECMGSDANYFLKFTEPSKRLSYAASFGITDVPKDKIEWYKKLLVEFGKVSVRESSGKELFVKLTGRTPEVVLDPTLLLNSEWIEIALSLRRIIAEKYILIYLMKETSTIFRKAKEYARINGLKVVYINDRLFGHLGITSLYYTSPEQWLNLFYYAECIFTNSFHGTIFSINMHKIFWVETLPPPSKVNSRILDILYLLGLESRIIGSESIVDNTQIDYQKVESILSSQRKSSMEFLKNI